MNHLSAFRLGETKMCPPSTLAYSFLPSLSTLPSSLSSLVDSSWIREDTDVRTDGRISKHFQFEIRHINNKNGHNKIICISKRFPAILKSQVSWVSIWDQNCYRYELFCHLMEFKTTVTFFKIFTVFYRIPITYITYLSSEVCSN